MVDFKRAVLYASLALNFALFVCFIALQYHNSTQGTNADTSVKEQNGDESVCFSCDYLGSKIKKEDTIFSEIVTTECGQRVCCIQNHALRNLVSQMLTSSEDELNPNLKRQIEWWRQRNDSAHMFIHPKTIKDGVLQWTTSDVYGVSFANGISNINNTLTVPSSGMYFVYSVLTLDFEAEKTVPVVYHHVTKWLPLLYRQPKAIVLMSKHGGSTETEKQFTSTLCGALYLQRGFQVETHFSDTIYIKDDIKSSYFGIFKL